MLVPQCWTQSCVYGSLFACPSSHFLSLVPFRSPVFTSRFSLSMFYIKHQIECKLIKILLYISSPVIPRKPNGDYRGSPISKDRSRSPIERVVVPGGLGVHSNHLYSHAHPHPHHHLASLAAMDQPLALTKGSMVESARNSTAAMSTMPHTVSAVERQQVTYTLFVCPPPPQEGHWGPWSGKTSHFV